ncbi:MAG TPA: hypothetical protein VGI66_03610 [Streptosporangiaceae bacterium]|jgi:hypothetical protein
MSEPVEAAQQPPLPDELSSPKAAAARIAELEAELAATKVELARYKPAAIAIPGSTETVRLRVEEPHGEMSYGGFRIGRDWTEVPVFSVAALQEAAMGAGVTLTQEG